MSHHQPVARKPAHHPAFALPETLSKLALPAAIVGLVLVLGGVLLATTQVGKQFGMSLYLTAVMYGLTLSLGSLFFVLIQHLVRAGWSVVVRRVAELASMMIVPMAILFVPIIFAAHRGGLYEWTSPNFAAEHGISDVIWNEKARWLNPFWFTIRSVLYFAVWIGIATYFHTKSQRQDETGEVKISEKLQGRAPIGIILFCLITSLAAFDFVMSLAPMWFSTMFGVYLFTGSFLSAHCLIALSSFLLQKNGAMRDEVTVEHFHDLGKLIFGFVCFWGYISFSQYMLIWYGNIPEETEWFYHRSVDGWWPYTIAMAVLHFGIPLFGIMSVHVRRRPWAVAAWAGYLLVLHFADLYWAIMPEVQAGFGGVMGVVASVVTALGMFALVGGLLLQVADRSRLVPVRDPRLDESLAFENI